MAIKPISKRGNKNIKPNGGETLGEVYNRFLGIAAKSDPCNRRDD
jgi:hypothetical protein